MTVREGVRRALALLSHRDRRLLGLSVAIQMTLSLLDLVGVLLIGLVGALSVTTIQSQPIPTPVAGVADLLGLGNLSNQSLVIVLSAAAAAVLLSKSILSSFLTRRVLVFLANRQALVSARLSKALLARPLTFIQERSTQETAYALIAGAGAATSQILGQLVIAATEVALLVVLGVALLAVSPWIALGSIAFFLLVALALQKAMGNWSSRSGRIAAGADIASLDAIQEALGAYREITVSDRREMYVDRIQDLRWQAAKVAADIQFIGMFPKYIFEGALVLGGFALAGVLFLTQDAVEAVGTFALFLAAATRVTPSLLRLQGAALGIRGAAGGAAPTFELAAALDHPTDSPEELVGAEIIRNRIARGNPDFDPTVKVRDVFLKFPGAPRHALSGVSMDIQRGQSVAFVGPSGAGKSSLADILLGVLRPDSGEVLLGGTRPSEAVSKWPGAVAYVPQSVVLANDTIRANVALGLPRQAIDDALVWEALERAHMADFLNHERDGLDTLIGEHGVKLSGGQRQRLGIARALYTRPSLLVMDEATSALDAETEASVSQTISELGTEVTSIIIAHRLSTVRDVHTLFYFSEGKLEAAGTFEAVVSQVPAFSRQAALMGIETVVTER